MDNPDHDWNPWSRSSMSYPKKWAWGAVRTVFASIKGLVCHRARRAAVGKIECPCPVNPESQIPSADVPDASRGLRRVLQI